MSKASYHLAYAYNSIFFICSLFNGEPDSSVSIVSGYGLEDQAIEIRSPAVAKGFFL
jgi:hypothetical protein